MCNYEGNVIVLHQIVSQLLQMQSDKSKACMGNFKYQDEEYFFTLATDKKELERMGELLIMANAEISKKNLKPEKWP